MSAIGDAQTANGVAASIDPDRWYQEWSRPRGRGTKAVGVIHCGRCQEPSQEGYIVIRLSPSAARGRRCFTCGADTNGGDNDG